MKFSTVATTSALLAVAAATPVGIAHHGHQFHKRAFVTNYVHVTKYVYENAHVYVDGNGNPVSTQYELVSNADIPTSTIVVVAPSSTSEPAPISTSTSTPPPPPPPSTSSSAAPSTFTSTVYVTQQTSTPTPSSTSTPPPPPPPTTSSEQEPTPTPTPSSTSTPPPPPPTSTSTPPPPPPTSTSTPPPPPPSSSAAAPASTGSTGGSGVGQYSGQATYYSPSVGLGSCGTQESDSDFIAALNAPMYGNPANPNDSPFCFKKAQVFRGDKSVIVTITDKCPTCAYGNLDLSPAAFDQIADEAEGRVEMTWSWL